MARMFPPDFDDSSPSAAERHIFNLLKNDIHTANWLVLHSLGLSRRPSGPYGEIDFVVIIPGEGLICLEVKGGRVSCESGVWKTTNRFGSTSSLKKSPMMQAREGMFALRERLKNHFGESAAETRCPTGCAVVFTDVPSPPATPEFERGDVIDVDDLNRPISEALFRIVRQRLRPLQPRGRDAAPSLDEAKSLLNFLRPDFELVVARGIRVGRSEERLLKLTEEQYSRLDELEDNPRCLFEGAAGTGKTLLALEHARRKAKSGARVALLCFNRMLGARLEEQTRGSSIRCGTERFSKAAWRTNFFKKKRRRSRLARFASCSPTSTRFMASLRSKSSATDVTFLSSTKRRTSAIRLSSTLQTGFLPAASQTARGQYSGISRVRRSMARPIILSRRFSVIPVTSLGQS
jgi:hypothetical protein